jgi:putative DNA primase/helicase
MELADVLDKLENVRSLPSGYSAKCPAHEDRVSSLMVNKGRTQPVVVHCHAGCAVEDVLAAIGLTSADLMGKAEIEQRYEYLNADGSVAYVMQRWRNPKTFRAEGKLPAPADRVLYQLPALAWARSAGATVHIVEGEKDVDRLVSMGLVATCNVGGAGSWLGHYGKSVEDCHVLIIADTDPVGRAHAREVAANCVQYAATVRLVVPRHGKDVSDLLDAGYTLDEVDELAWTEELATYVAANVKTRRVDWAWQGYIPLGKLTIVEGDPGDGKSVLTLDLTARWSAGKPLPDGSDPTGPYRVILVSAEDDMADTIVPRLFAAGARLEGVELVPHGATPDKPFEFARDLEALERRVVETGARIIVFDPLTAFLSAGTDTHNDMQVRHALYPLKALAERTRAAVLCVRHLNKGGQGVKAIYRGNGSIAFTGAARVGFLVGVDPDNPRGRLLACVKSNLALKPPSMRYEIESTPDGTPYVAWHGTSGVDAQGALDGPKRASEIDDETAANNRARQYEIEFLEDLLADGPMAWREIVAAGKAEGFADRSLRRARADIGLVKLTGDGGNRDARWSLRSTPDANESQDGTPLGHLATDLGDRRRAQNGWPSGQVADGQGEILTDEQRAAALDATPDACSVCGDTNDVVRYNAPLWTKLCPLHFMVTETLE